MKTIKTISFAALAALAATSAAMADTTIRIVASNGDRTATQTAISKLLGTTWRFHGINGNIDQTGDLTKATGANYGAWRGTFNGETVVIKVSYSGALAAIAAISGNTTQRFVKTNALASDTSTVVVPTGTASSSDYEEGKADFGFSTNFQSTSPYNGTLNGVPYEDVDQKIVGVSPLGFYASPGFPGDNITTQQAQALYSQGSLRLWQLTGNYTDHYQKTVWALGRNTDAGQRYGAYTEIGLGTQQAVRVWKPTYSALTGETPVTPAGTGITYGGVVASHEAWPAEGEINGISVDVGNGGFDTGANLAKFLTATLGSDAYKGKINATTFQYPSATAGYYIGYLTPGDANNRVLGKNNVVPVDNRGKALKYNGVELTDANVKNGQYTAWLYNRILRPLDGRLGEEEGSIQSLFADALEEQIKTVDAVQGGGLKNDGDFKVRRFTDGGLVVPK